MATRAELMRGYSGPYGRWLPVAWETERVRRAMLRALAFVSASLAANLVVDGHWVEVLVWLSVVVVGLAIGYGAVMLARRPFDPVDAARAAEQLAAAQEEAAEIESGFAVQAHRRLAAAEEELELEREAASTARALRRITGQSPD